MKILKINFLLFLATKDFIEYPSLPFITSKADLPIEPVDPKIKILFITQKNLLNQRILAK